ncbi:hypothetical protein QVD17_10949 [Tagetes erecta]|uniref:F-box domain-containing protein n=1 Tax=Tagetes erecta TaxID=13708 RepID=A0AAD8L7J2_TARER|nr:hypothetical protein QVD17_10949 [Tagetes erecta]
MEPEPNFEELPDEIWELILNRLGDDHHSQFDSISLVSKRLLSLTDCLRLHFTVVDQSYITHGTIYPLISRFVNLKTLDLSKLKYINLEAAISEIARSSVAMNLQVIDISNQISLPIESLKELGQSNRKIKVLRCAYVGKLRDQDLITIAKFYPDLEELDISYPLHKLAIAVVGSCDLGKTMITDAGIEHLSSGLKNLIKINVSMNPLLTDKSLVSLSSNCLRLQEILFEKSVMITMEGVLFMLHNSPSLRSISACLIANIYKTDSIVMNPATSCRHLSNLCLKDSSISNELLNSIVEARFPLKSVCLSSCSYSLDGLSNFLSAYPSIRFLDLSNNKFFRDGFIISLSQCLHDLVSVKLNFCTKLTRASLLALFNKCLFLENVEMEHTNLGKNENSILIRANHPRTNLSIKSLNLGLNSHLSDECLLKINSACPKLKRLDVNSCIGITWSIGEILKICPEVEHLSIQNCGGVMNIGLKMEPLRLKKLYMARSGVNDQGLGVIAARCNELVKIDLEGCRFVTISAVKFMVKKCEKLREINLMGCPNLHVFIVEWLVHTRPSLRKLIPPSYAVTTENQRQLMLRRGCKVCAK